MAIHAHSSDEIDTYLESLWLERGLAENTLSAYRRDLADTAKTLQAMGISQLSTAEEADLLEVLNRKLVGGAYRPLPVWNFHSTSPVSSFSA